MVYSTSFLFIPGWCGWLWVVPYFIKKVKAHKTRQKLETLEKGKAPKELNTREPRKRMKAREAHNKMKTCQIRKKLGHARHLKI